MKLRTHRVELPLEHPFTIARGTRHTQRSLILEIEHDGVRGFGEATEHAYYGVTIEQMALTVEHCRSAIEDFDGESPQTLWDSLRSRLADDMFLLAAIDCAAHDLAGKLSGQRTYATLGLSWSNIPVSSFTIGIDEIDHMIKKMAERSAWSIFKIKLGTDHDIEIVEQLREHTTATFRVDANCGWTVDETINNSRALKELGVEFIEQPLPADATFADQQDIFRNSALPIIADESCIIEPDVEKCSGQFHGVNVKLSKCGGITPAYRMLQIARDLGMKTMVGCMVETSVGISAAAQLLPLLDYADLDGAELLAADAAHGVSVVNGHVILPDQFGNGSELLESIAPATNQ